MKLEADLFMGGGEPQDSSRGGLIGQPWGRGPLLTRAQGRNGLEASETKAATRKG